MKIAVQVYSVRDAINDEKSLLAALEKIKEANTYVKNM